MIPLDDVKLPSEAINLLRQENRIYGLNRSPYPMEVFPYSVVCWGRFYLPDYTISIPVTLFMAKGRDTSLQIKYGIPVRIQLRFSGCWAAGVGDQWIFPELGDNSIISATQIYLGRICIRQW